MCNYLWLYLSTSVFLYRCRSFVRTARKQLYHFLKAFLKTFYKPFTNLFLKPFRNQPSFTFWQICFQILGKTISIVFEPSIKYFFYLLISELGSVVSCKLICRNFCHFCLKRFFTFWQVSRGAWWGLHWVPAGCWGSCLDLECSDLPGSFQADEFAGGSTRWSRPSPHTWNKIH